MPRTDPRQLHQQAFDLIVIGAGIQGAAVAREAALRRLSVLLVEARDLAAGTSSRSSRLVHGGLRYLRQGNLALVREALAERERLLRCCPHLVRPLPMLMPFFTDGGGSRWLARLGIGLYARLARQSTLPRPRALSAADAATAFPGLRTRGLGGAVEFFDAATQDARLTLANVLGAAAAGARVATHTEVIGCHGDALQLRDRLGDAVVQVRAPHVVNAAGPRADAVRATLGVGGGPLVRTSRGSHLVLAARPGELALAAFLPDGRIQFVIPHDDGTLCGTTDVDDELVGDEGGPPVADADYLLAALGFLLDPAPTRADVRFAYAGWRSLPRGKGPPGALHREAFVVDEALPTGRLHTIVGGKLTTHRSFAERLVQQVFGCRGASPTRTLPLPGGEGPREVAEPLWWRHGSRIALLRQIVHERAELAAPLCPHRPFVVAELVHALRDDFAVTFADVMLRRLVHGQGPCLDGGCLQRAYEWFRHERPWPVDDDADRVIAALRDEVAVLRGDLAAPAGAT